MFHPDPNQFIRASADYGPIGQTIVALSRLEFAHDDFIFTVHNEHPTIATTLSKNFPRQFKPKVDFLIDALFALPYLRAMPISADGWLDLHWLQFQLDELYEIRAVIAHGSIEKTIESDGVLKWQFARVTKLKSKKGAWVKEKTSVGSSFLARVVETANILRRYLWNLQSALKKETSWEEIYQTDKKIRKNQKLISELIETGNILLDSPNMPVLKEQKNNV